MAEATPIMTNTTNTAQDNQSTTTVDAGQNVTNAATIPADAVILSKPVGGSVTVDVEANTTYAVSFDANDAQLELNNGDLTFEFADGSQLILDNFAQTSPMPTIMLPNGTILAGDVIVAQLMDPATEDVFNLETAAGPAAGGGQFTYSDDFGDVIGLLDLLPPLPFTSLAFTTPEIDEPLLGPADGAGGFTPTFFTPFTGDVEGFSGGFEDWKPFQNVGNESLFPMQLLINYVPDANEAGAPDAVQAINIDNIDAGTRFFIGQPGNPGSFTEITVNGDEVTIDATQLTGGNSIFVLSPVNSDVDLTMTINVTVVDPDTGDVTVLTQDVTAIIDAAADQPDVDGTISAGGATDASSVTAAEEASIQLNLDIDFGDTDGSETHTITINGIPQEWTLANDGGLSFDGPTLNANGTVSYTATVNAGFDGSVVFDPNEWNTNDNGTATINVVSTATETPTDGELLDSNNQSSVTQTFQVTLIEDVPVIQDVTSVVIDENELTIPGADTVDGTITVDYFNDEPGTVALTTGGLSALGLTSGGDALAYAVSNGGSLLTATDANGDTVFTVTLNDGFTTNGSEQTFTYTFELLQPLDHGPNGSATDNALDIPVQFIVTDSDGDTDSGQLGLTVLDDTPMIAAGNNTVDETTDLGDAITGIIMGETGADNSVDVSLNGDFNASVPLTSNGVPVVVSETSNGYVGTANGETIFTLTINLNGSYNFVLENPIDHPDANNPNDSVVLNFGYTLTDGDGDQSSSALSINILDDGPVAVSDSDFVADGQTVATGNVLTNDNLSEDTPNTIDEVSFGSQTASFANDAQSDAGGDYVEINGDYGVLKVYANGEYTYTYNDGNASGSYTEAFQYTLIDADNDTSTTTLTLDITDNGPGNPVNVEQTIDETNSLGKSFAGTVSVADASVYSAGNTSGAGDFDADGSLLGGSLTSNGTAVDVSMSGNTYTGMANGETVFTLMINEDGGYEFIQYAVLDHADGSNPNDVIDLEFAYTASDADGDAVEGTITIHVRDDAPLAIADTGSVSASNVVLTGNVIDNDDVSEDTPNVLNEVSFNSTTASFDAPDGSDANGQYIVIDGDFGSLKIYANGDYVYTYDAANNAGDQVENFTYTLVDYDGDTSDAALIINITDNGPGNPATVENVVDETFITQTVSEKIAIDYGADGVGELTLANMVDASGSLLGGDLTSNGVAVTTSVLGNTLTGSAGGEDVFTLTLQNDGTYSFTLLGPIDHADGSNPNDVIDLTFDYTVSDADGDKANGEILIHVRDDAPAAGNIKAGLLDETSGFDQSLNGSVGSIDFGMDGAGDVTGNGDFTAINSMGNAPLSSGGDLITVNFSGNTYTATAGGEVVFTMTINDNGSYVFNLLQPLDHANASNPNDVVRLNFGYNVVDADGDAAEAIIAVDIRDDAPVAVDDMASVSSGMNTVTGNVIDNDDMSEDVPNTIQDITSDGMTMSFDDPSGSDANGKFIAIEGQYGSLKIYENGDYTYVYDDATSAGNVTENFTYTLVDYDGDSSEATLKISISDTGPDKPVVVENVVDETFITQTVSDKIDIDYGADGEGSLTLANMVDASGSLLGDDLTSNSVAVTTSVSGNTLTGSAGGKTIFTLELNDDGTYSFTLLGPIDHADGSNPNDVIDLTFDYNVSDADGDSVTGQILIHVRDDAPLAVADMNSLSDGQTIATGNIIDNDDASQDVENLIQDVSFEGNTVSFDNPTGTDSNGAYVEIEGDHGTLVLYEDGDYVYTYDAANNSGDQTEEFEYTLVDGDGDTSTTTLTFDITGADPVLIVGDNVDDIPSSDVPYIEGEGDGSIIGDTGYDILIGDAGGSNITNAGKDYNIVLILDVSNSMTGTKLGLLKEAVINLLNDYNDYSSGQVKVHMVPFNTVSGAPITLTVTNDDEYQQAVNFVNNLTATGLTNFEASLQSAISWLQGDSSNDPIAGAETLSYFVSDGEPNHYIDNNGNVQRGTTDKVLGEILGADGTNEVAMLQSLSDDVISVGIEVSDADLRRLDLIDQGKDALDVENAEDLDGTLQEVSPIQGIVDVGSDIIDGGLGNDLIFGDSVNTDQLIDDMGLNGSIGSSWRGFQFLETNIDGWDRADTIDYILNNPEELARESISTRDLGRDGGNDSINGGVGNDMIFGQEGDDVINGGAGDDLISGGTGNNNLTGGEGADTFLFLQNPGLDTGAAPTGGFDTITDYSNSENDALDISDLLTSSGYIADVSDVADFINIDEQGNVYVDPNASGNFANDNQIATINNVTGFDTINVIFDDDEGAIHVTVGG